MRRIADVYYSMYYALYRMAPWRELDHESRRTRGWAGLNLVDLWAVVIVYGVVRSFFPAYAIKTSRTMFLAPCIGILFVNSWLLLLRGRGDEFGRRFEAFPAPRQARVMRVAWSIMGGVLTFFVAALYWTIG